jgi:hypothetical protein
MTHVMVPFPIGLEEKPTDTPEFHIRTVQEILFEPDRCFLLVCVHPSSRKTNITSGNGVVARSAAHGSVARMIR